MLIAVVATSLLGWAASARAATDTVTSAADSGPGSLRAAIGAASDGDTIDFDASLDGQAIVLTSGAIEIDKSLMIDGPGATQLTIDADHNSQIFTVSAGNLSISGLALADGAAPAIGEAAGLGGAIEQAGGGTLTVAGCTFTGNTAGGAGDAEEESNQGHGGAISVSSSSGSTTVSDSTFTANAAGGPGGAGFQSGLGSGGAIWDANPGSLTVTDSTFTDNTAGGDGDGVQGGNGAGGAIQKSGGLVLIVSDSEFVDNTAGGDGGDENNSGHGHGGAIYVSEPSPPSTDLSVVDSTFSGNAAGGTGGVGGSSGTGEGGAIEHYGEGSVSVSGSTFEGNSAGGVGGVGGATLFGLGVGSGGGIGGAILIDESEASTSIADSEFRENTAGGAGGGGSLSGFGVGGAIKDEAGGSGDQFAISDSTFRENAVGGAKGAGSGSGRGTGGAIDTLGGLGLLKVTDSTFWANAVSAGAGGIGGAIRMFNMSLTVSGSTFAGNTVGEAGGGGSGGAIDAGAISLNTVASISDSTLFGNDAGGGGAGGDGGALDISGMRSATLASVTIDGNSVGMGGTGAGIRAGGEVPSETAIVTAKATIVSSNTGATNCDVPVASSSYSLEGPEGKTSCGFDLPSADPELGPLFANGGPTKTQALPAGSLAVDAVPVAKCPTKVDQRGEPRPDNGKSVCDVGAYELQDPPIAPSITGASAVTFQVGKAASFTINATGLPVPDLSETGALPIGIVFTDHGDGTASLVGTSAAGTGGSYPIMIKASNGALPDAEQSFTLTVQAPPTASIAIPVDGATYTQGQTINSSFACAEGISGPRIASCVDQDRRPSGASLDTAAAGRHTFTVSATSKDGLTSTASVAYTVVRITPKVPLPPRPGVLVSYRLEGGIGGPRPSLVVFKNRRARLTLGGCTAKFALPPAAWSKLRAALKGAHLHAIAGNYPAPKGSADVITYVIKARGEVVRIAPPQPEHKRVMRDLRPLLNDLNKLVSAGKRPIPSHCKSSRS